MQCPKCGHDNRIGAAFCAGCGTSLAYLLGRMRLQPGQTIKGGAYEVLQPLTQGGMGAIYVVQDQEAFGRLRILKEMLDYVDPADFPDRAAYGQAVQRAHERFEAEARILASLHHPGIPEIIAYFSEQGRNYIVMEYVEGEDLNEGLTHVDDQGQVVAGGPYPAEDVVRWGIQVCKILEYLAQQRPTPVIHHDVKPANLVVDKQTGNIWLVDFGTAQARLAAQADPTVALKKPSIFGTIGYAPPEQYQGKSVPRSDVYALAATMYHLLTDDDPQQHPMSFPWPEELGRQLERALGQAVEPDLRRRSSAAEFRQALERWLQEPPQKRAADRKGNFRVVLGYVPDQVIVPAIEALHQELSMTERQATIKAYSAPVTVMSTTSFNAADRVVARLAAAGAGARVVEVDERYSTSLGLGAMRQHLVKRGQLRRIEAAKLSRGRQCHCFVCGHDWKASWRGGRQPPEACPRCKSKQWSLRRVFKCQVCGHEFAHGDQNAPGRQLFPTCPACGTLDWLDRASPVLRILNRKLDLGTVRLGQARSFAVAIRNRGKGSLRGVVRGREPWLGADRGFEGEDKVTVSIDTGLLKGEQRYQGVLDVLSNGGAQQVQVEFTTETPEQVSVSPAALDFGQVGARPASQVLRVSNSGGGRLQGTVTADVSWLKLSATEIAGNRLDLSVVTRPAQMPSGQRSSASIGLRTNGGEVAVPVQARALPPRLTLTPQSLDFGAVPPGEVHRLVVHLANAGTGRLKGRATARPGWVNLSRVRWSGNALDLVVEVDGRRLSDGLERTGTVRFSSNGGEADLVVRAAALAPTLAVEPSAVYMSAVQAGSRARCRLRLTNLGTGRLNGTIHSTASWLRPERQTFSGKSARLSAWIETDGLAPGDHTATLEIDSNGGKMSVVVQVQVISQRKPSRRLRLFR